MVKAKRQRINPRGIHRDPYNYVFSYLIYIYILIMNSEFGKNMEGPV